MFNDHSSFTVVVHRTHKEHGINVLGNEQTKNELASFLLKLFYNSAQRLCSFIYLLVTYRSAPVP